MRRSRRWTERLSSDDGSASIEFVGAGVLLLVPIVYLVLALAQLQGAALAVEGAARQASRVFVQSPTAAAAEDAAERAIAVTLADYGLDASEATVAVTCRPDPSHCLTRRGFVTVDVGLTVPMPLFPAMLDVDLPGGVPIASTSTEQVSRFWGAR